MCAQVLKFRRGKATADTGSKSVAEPAIGNESAAETSQSTSSLQFWVGASGTRYIHTVHSLVDCPEIPAVNYLLVHRGSSGDRRVLAAGHAAHEAPSLNLAEVRKLGAALGANEVHLHMLAGSTKEAKVIEHDLRLGQICDSVPTNSPLRH
jgi:putative NIF3 family GTP cyclohydrolase 1 type 2